MNKKTYEAKQRIAQIERRMLLDAERRKKPARVTLSQNGWTEYAIGFDTHKKGWHDNQCQFDIAKLTNKERSGLKRWTLELLMKIERFEDKSC